MDLWMRQPLPRGRDCDMLTFVSWMSGMIYALHGMYCIVDFLDALDDMVAFSVTDAMYIYIWLSSSGILQRDML